MTDDTEVDFFRLTDDESRAAVAKILDDVGFSLRELHEMAQGGCGGFQTFEAKMAWFSIPPSFFEELQNQPA